MKSLYKNEQSGRSMVEMLGVLAIIGVLSIGGISGYSKAMAKYRVNKTLDQISMLVINIRTLFSSSVNYDGLDAPLAIGVGIIPGDMKNGSGSSATIINSYQGSVNIGNPGNDVRRFYINYTDLNSEACVSISTADWGTQTGSGLEAIVVDPTNSAEVSAVPTSGAAPADGGKGTFVVGDNIPISLANANKSCQGEKNSITWYYY